MWKERLNENEPGEEVRISALGPAGSSRTGSRLLAVSVALLALGLLAAVALVLNSSPLVPPLAAQTLPDGTLLRVERVTFGTSHAYEEAGGGFLGLTGWLPWLRRRAATESTPAPAAVFWITRRSPASPRRCLGFEWWSDYDLLDEHGCRFTGEERRVQTVGIGRSSTSAVSPGNVFQSQPAGPSDLVVGSIAAEAFPRRSGTLRLRLSGSWQQPVATFALPNPAPGRYPVWEPAPLPARRQFGDPQRHAPLRIGTDKRFGPERRPHLPPLGRAGVRVRPRGPAHTGVERL